MNAKANATVFPAPGLLRGRIGGPSPVARRTNKAYLKALREAEMSAWTTRESAPAAGESRPARRLMAASPDRTESAVMVFLGVFAAIAVASLFYAGFGSGDVLAGVRSVVEGVLR